MLQLWINEIRYTYFEKLSSGPDFAEMKDRVSKVLLYYFGNEAVQLLEESDECMIGDFLDSYHFYTTNEMDELREFVVEEIGNVKVREIVDYFGPGSWKTSKLTVIGSSLDFTLRKEKKNQHHCVEFSD